jgi:hypothetical protein
MRQKYYHVGNRIPIPSVPARTGLREITWFAHPSTLRLDVDRCGSATTQEFVVSGRNELWTVEAEGW